MANNVERHEGEAGEQQVLCTDPGRGAGKRKLSP